MPASSRPDSSKEDAPSHVLSMLCASSKMTWVSQKRGERGHKFSPRERMVSNTVDILSDRLKATTNFSDICQIYRDIFQVKTKSSDMCIKNER